MNNSHHTLTLSALHWFPIRFLLSHIEPCTIRHQNTSRICSILTSQDGHSALLTLVQDRKLKVIVPLKWRLCCSSSKRIYSNCPFFHLLYSVLMLPLLLAFYCLYLYCSFMTLLCEKCYNKYIYI